jgi:hypothetical protein
VIALSDAGWGFLGVLVAQVVILAGLWFNWHRVRRDVVEINHAVNHRPEGAPTLVERVGIIEAETLAHRTWEREAFTALSRHVGFVLPPYPEEWDGTDRRSTS